VDVDFSSEEEAEETRMLACKLDKMGRRYLLNQWSLGQDVSVLLKSAANQLGECRDLIRNKKKEKV
jgi:hypothetical protein